MTLAATPAAPPQLYAQELILSALVYMTGTAILRWVPLPFDIPTTFNATAALLTLISAVIFGAVAFLVARGRPPGQRLAAAGALTLPVLLGDAVETAAFADVFPRFDPAAAGVFAALLLFTNFAILGAGWIAERVR